MKQQSVHRFIYKIESKQLKQSNWNLYLPVKTAMKSYPELIVSLNESQCLRFIDEINGVGNIDDRVREIQKKIRQTKKLPKSPKTKLIINSCYDILYDLQFQKDYICVIMNSNSDYDRANKGFTINYGETDGKETIIKYKRFLGTNGGIKNSTIVYVNEEIYPELKKRLDNGRNKNKELVPAKLEAYQALICSGSTPLPEPKGIIVVPDCEVLFKEDVIVIDDSNDGEPQLNHIKDYEVKHNNSDGFGLMLPSYSRRVNMYLNGSDDTISGMNTRYSFEKGMLYTFDYIEFAEEVAGTFYIKDVWGTLRDVRESEVILTESMLKLWSSYDSWEDYYNNCAENHYCFSTPKTTPDILENVRDTNYQFLQSYEFTDDEIKELCQPTIDEIQDVIGLDYRKSLTFLAGYNLNERNAFGDNFENYVKALMADKDMINDPFIRKKIYNMIRKRIEMGERGAVRVNGNYAMISGDLYALAQSMFGLEVTGLLKAGEVYHKYWLDKGAEEIACFRAPMTCHNNIRKMKISRSEEAAHWFRYVDTALIYNTWDTATEAMNGSDFDGDTNMCSDNPILVNGTKNSETIICLQKKAKAKVPTETDLIQSNKLAFNDEIGIITNHVTSMFDVQAGFSPDSEEYKTLAYRIMCGQHYQQAAIDRCKGVISKPMPVYWYSMKGLRVNDDDDEGDISAKMFNQRIVASNKPYFMTYVYPKLKTKNNTYVKNSNRGAAWRFADIGVGSVADLNKRTDNTEVSQYLDYYSKLSPVGNNTCIINRISKIFEGIFKGYLSKKHIYPSFDKSIIKSNVDYSKSDYDKVYKLYKEYISRVENFQKKIKSNKLDKDTCAIEKQRFAELFRAECEKVCPNEDELCDIVIDICYGSEKSKQFAWDICGDTIIRNLLNRNGNMITYPEQVDKDGEFEYCGRQFVMKKIEVGENKDGSLE